MEGARQTTTGRRAEPPRCSRASVLCFHFLHDFPQRRQAVWLLFSVLLGTAARLARTELHADAGIVGIVGLVLVRRLPGGRRLLRRGRLVRRCWCVGQFSLRSYGRPRSCDGASGSW